MNMPLSGGAFRTVISSRRQYKVHSSTLECGGVVLGFKWLLRQARDHSKRVTFLIDAQAVLGAISKGRSSAGAIKRDVKFAAALLLAGDVALSCTYIPSEDNPADDPSRGIVRNRRTRAFVVPTHLRKGTAAHTRAPAKKVLSKAAKTSTQRATARVLDDISTTIWRMFMLKALRKLTRNTCTSTGRFIHEIATPTGKITYNM